eukprot:scaffold151825_cov32-Tisochrysis_lutea.AAC.2
MLTRLFDHACGGNVRHTRAKGAQLEVIIERLVGFRVTLRMRRREELITRIRQEPASEARAA